METGDNFTKEDISSLIDIFKLDLNEDLNYSMLSRAIGFKHSSDARFEKIISFLMSKNILKEKGSFGSAKRIKIDRTKLKEEIPEIPFIKKFHEDFIKDVWKKGFWIYK